MSYLTFAEQAPPLLAFGEQQFRARPHRPPLLAFGEQRLLALAKQLTFAEQEGEEEQAPVGRGSFFDCFA